MLQFTALEADRDHAHLPARASCSSLPNFFSQGDAGAVAALGAQDAAQPRPRPARRRAPAAGDGSQRRPQGLARDPARRRAQAPARGQDRRQRGRHRQQRRAGAPRQGRGADAALKALQQHGPADRQPLLGTTGHRHRGDRRAKAAASPSRRPRPGCSTASATPSAPPSRPCAGASTPWAPPSPTSCARAASRILVQVPGLQDTAQLKELIGKTARLSFHEVHATLTAGGGQDRRACRPATRSIPASTRRRAAQLLRETPVVRGDELTTRQPAFDSAHQRADHRLPLQQRRRAQVRQVHPGPRRPAVRHRARRQGDLGAGDPRADPGRVAARSAAASRPRPPPSSPSSCRSGALPAKLTIVEERTVGPSLGSDFDRGRQARRHHRRHRHHRPDRPGLRHLRHLRRASA